jgi:Spy/CpxP family protein refolding chaperone
MSSAVAPQPPVRRTGLWVKILLALSLVLNIFFVAGAAWHIVQGPPERGFRREVERTLDLDEAQRHAYEDFARTMGQARRQLRDSNEPLADEALAEQSKATPDQARLTDLVSQADRNRQKFAQIATTALGSFMATLNPHQRELYADLVKKRREHFADRPGHRPMP